MVDIARYAFRLSAWNELAGVDDSFILLYYVKNDGTSDIEIANPKLKKRFLSRIQYAQLKLDDIRPGARIMIYSRQYKVEDYEDPLTREALGKTQQTSFCLVTEAATSAIGRVWQASEASGLRGVAARMVTLTDDDARTVSQAVGAAVPAGPALALSLMGEKSDEKVRALASHIHEKAGVPANSVLCAESARANDALTAAFFGDRKGRLPSANTLSGGFTDCAAVLVLPGALSAGNAGNILAEVQERASASGLSLSALRMTSFTRGEAEEFLEVYKGVVPEYVEMVNELSRGPFIAIEVTGPDAVAHMREAAGPRDIEVAKRVRAHSLRAKFGVSAGASGVHVSDLVQDGPLECEYLFALTDR